MTSARQSVVDSVSPSEAFDLLSQPISAALVDVRTYAEWTFTGLPEISATGKPFWPIEWASFPTMAPNPNFLDQLVKASDGDLPDRLFFICRSGSRSMSAAQLVASEFEAKGRVVHCSNVSEGFEGDLDAAGHRGAASGWKARGLPWRQN